MIELSTIGKKTKYLSHWSSHSVSLCVFAFCFTGQWQRREREFQNDFWKFSSTYFPCFTTYTISISFYLSSELHLSEKIFSLHNRKCQCSTIEQPWREKKNTLWKRQWNFRRNVLSFVQAFCRLWLSVRAPGLSFSIAHVRIKFSFFLFLLRTHRRFWLLLLKKM